MANPWFETVAEAQRRAKKRLPESVYKALVAGSERGVTLRDNVNAFSELGLAPHVVGLQNERDLSTTVLGQDIALPVICSPTGVQAVHPDGEVAVARAAANRGTAMGLSSFGSKPIEEVVAANPKTFFQLYWAGSKDDILARVERATAGRCGRPHRHARLVVLDGPRLGLADDPGRDEPQDHGPVRAAGDRPAALVLHLGQDAAAAGPHRAEHGHGRAAGADVLRRVRGVDAARRCRPGRTWPGCGSSGAGRSCSRA